MQQIKIFKGVESELTSLQNEINDWLRTTGVRVLHVTGNIAPQTTVSGVGSGLSQGAYPPSDVVLVMVYED